MIQPVGRERLLELLLSGAPDRVVDGLAALHPADAADLAQVREDFADLALAAPAATPSAALRARLLAGSPRPRRPVRPVLLVLDMINDYLTPGGPLEVPRARNVVAALADRLRQARMKGVPVVYVCDTHPPDDPDFRDWPRHAVEGTAGADVWPAIAPEPGETIVRKRTYSAFTGSTLGAHLDALGADEIVLTGCATEVGMAATATDALQRGFVVTIPPDCQAGASEMVEGATLLVLSAMPPFEPRYLRAAARA